MGQRSGSVRSAGAEERTDRTLDATAYRQVIGHFMSGVVVVTANHEGRNRGMTVSAIASLSLDPPMLITCLNAASGTQEVVRRAGAFAVNVLAEDQGDIAEAFARPGPDPFDRVPYLRGLTGAPVLSDALAVFECRVAEVVEGGSHRVFLAQSSARGRGTGRPSRTTAAGSAGSRWHRTRRRTGSCVSSSSPGGCVPTSGWTSTGSRPWSPSRRRRSSTP